MRRSLVLPWLTVLVLCPLAGCRESPPAAEPSLAPERVENPDLQIAIAGVPGGFDVAANEGATLELVRERGLPPGRAWVAVGDAVEGGINLIEIIRGQREVFEALPGGSFAGNGELVLPDGRPAYYSRGRFQDEEGTVVEEFRVWSVHPVEANRLLQVFYRYAAGEDSVQRLEDVLLLVGEIEGLPGPDAPMGQAPAADAPTEDAGVAESGAADS